MQGSPDARLAQHDAQIEAIERDLGRVVKTVESLSAAVAAGFNGIKDSLSDLAEKQVGAGRWSKQDVAAILGVMVSIVLVSSTLIVSHVNGRVGLEEARREGAEKLVAMQLAQHDRASAENALRGVESARVIAEIQQKLNEVETQFFWAGDVESGERADNDRLVRLLWHKVYGEELPAKLPYQRGPQKHSAADGMVR